MALQLTSVADSIQSRLNRLSTDHDIKRDLTVLVVEGKEIANKISNAITTNGREVMKQKDIVTSASSPSDVRTEDMQTAMQNALQSSLESKYLIVKMQTSIHINIEACRKSKLYHEERVNNKRASVERLTADIGYLETQIDTHETDIVILKEGAAQLDDRARSLIAAADKKKASGIIGGIISLGVGMILAPFTMGTSLLVATAVGGIHACINFDNANDCTKSANSLRDTASTKRREAESYRADKRRLAKEKSTLEREIKSLEREKAELEEATCVLHDTTVFLQSSIEVTNSCIEAFQDLEGALKDTHLQGDAFIIIQAAFTNNPDKLTSYAQRHMEKLKEKWNNMENVLIRNKAIQ